jgi:hypothetical protein
VYHCTASGKDACGRNGRVARVSHLRKMIRIIIEAVVQDGRAVADVANVKDGGCANVELRYCRDVETAESIKFYRDMCAH